METDEGPVSWNLWEDLNMTPSGNTTSAREADTKTEN